MVLGLVDALYIDFALFALGHADGVEADHLADGLGHGFVLDVGGDSKIFQLIIEEVDGVVAGFFGQLAQRVAHRHFAVVAGHTLGLCCDKGHAAHKENDGFSHGLTAQLIGYLFARWLRSQNGSCPPAPFPGHRLCSTRSGSAGCGRPRSGTRP